MISNVDSLAIGMSSIREPLAIVPSHWSTILTLYLWTLSSRWRCQPGYFNMTAHCHDHRGIYRCVLLHFRGRIEIDHPYGLRCHSCCARSYSTDHISADHMVVNSYIRPHIHKHICLCMYTVSLSIYICIYIFQAMISLSIKKEKSEQIYLLFLLCGSWNFNIACHHQHSLVFNCESGKKYGSWHLRTIE